MGLKLNIFFLFMSVIAYMVYNFIGIADVFKELTEVNSKSCRKVKGVIGAEDVVKFGKFLITSSGDRLKLWEHREIEFEAVPYGGLYLIDPETEKTKLLVLGGFPKDVAFHPHGVYYTSNNLLYVINHAYNKGGERVEIFEIDPNSEQSFAELRLRYKYSIIFEEPFNGRLNDLVVTKTGEKNDEIYITTYLPFQDPYSGRDKSIPNKLRTIMVFALKLKWTYVYYCNGLKADGHANCSQILNENIPAIMNNGITLDTKRNKIYVARTLEKTVGVFNIDKNDHGVLHFEREIKLNNAADNLFYDADHDYITTGAIGRLKNHFEFIDHSVTKEGVPKDFICWCGAEKIDPNTNEAVNLVMQSKLFCGASGSAVANNKVFIGSWADDGILICDL